MGSLGYIGIYEASIRYIDLLEDSYNGNYPLENVLDHTTDGKSRHAGILAASVPPLRREVMKQTWRGAAC